MAARLASLACLGLLAGCTTHRDSPTPQAESEFELVPEIERDLTKWLAAIPPPELGDDSTIAFASAPLECVPAEPWTPPSGPLQIASIWALRHAEQFYVRAPDEASRSMLDWRSVGDASSCEVEYVALDGTTKWHAWHLGSETYVDENGDGNLDFARLPGSTYFKLAYAADPCSDISIEMVPPASSQDELQLLEGFRASVDARPDLPLMLRFDAVGRPTWLVWSTSERAGHERYTWTDTGEPARVDGFDAEGRWLRSSLFEHQGWTRRVDFEVIDGEPRRTTTAVFERHGDHLLAVLAGAAIHYRRWEHVEGSRRATLELFPEGLARHGVEQREDGRLERIEFARMMPARDIVVSGQDMLVQIAGTGTIHVRDECETPRPFWPGCSP